MQQLKQKYEVFGKYLVSFKMYHVSLDMYKREDVSQAGAW